MPPARPGYVRDRELTVTGSWARVLAFDAATINLLFSRVELAKLPALDRSTPKHEDYTLLCGEDISVLFLGSQRIASIATKEKR